MSNVTVADVDAAVKKVTDAGGTVFTKGPEMPGPAAWLYYIRVDDLDASVEKAKSTGAKLLNGPMDVPGGDHIAQLMDPQGAAFALVSAIKPAA